MRTIWIIIMTMMSCAAQAGPWLRSGGEGFLAVDSIGSVGRDQGNLRYYSGIYAEYGLNDQVTLGLHAGQELYGDAQATIFARFPIHLDQDEWAFAYDIGLGVDLKREAPKKALRLGMSVGRSMQIRQTNGWWSIEAQIRLRAQTGRDLKMETTVGVKDKKERLYILQGFAQKTAGSDWTYELQPTVVIPLFRNAKLQVGLSASTEGEGRYGARISTWRRF
ncbi:hypothetical protein [Cognatishimia activa]|uniref:Uncharacterized protein n=1 Tax=Cognatishimia activa TaxID=1715691 RepID=A0A0P1JA58_9RHOB|nr:hypothetical protein [Cognatishimia activa]CUI67592.1 hypothetical protein TA5113_01119 [Cognatishimia activa]CUK26482.1 hypothetical protein TA5114_02292 [Cognatishimia activa]